VSVSLVVQNWFERHLLLLGGAGVLLLAFAAFLFVLVWRLTRGKPVRFAVVIGDAPVSAVPTSLAPGREIFLSETGGTFSLIARRNARSIARFSAKAGKLGLAVLKADRFPKLKDLPPDARGHTFALRSQNGRNLTMKVQSKERKK